MSKKNDVAMPTLTPEQEALLRERFRKEEAVSAVAAEQHVYTNVTKRAIVVPDLGVRTGNTFSPESFAPGETKDLRDMYRLREIRASRHLTIRKKQGVLVAGTADEVAGKIDASMDPIARMAADRPTGSFRDPLSGQRPYDIKLKAVEEKFPGPASAPR